MSAQTSPDDLPPVLARLFGAFGRFLIALGVLLLLFAAFQLWGTGLAESRAQSELERRFLAQLAEAGQDRATSGLEGATATARGPESGVEAEPTGVRPVLVVPPIPDDAALPADHLGLGPDPRSYPDRDLERAVEPASTTDGPPAGAEPDVRPATGDPIGVIEIPAIGVRKAIVEGTTREVLRNGPGHYRSTPLPGRSGNTAIAGHRTTHGAPFFDIDLLQPGDEISVETLDGTATYLVEAHDDGVGGQVGHLIVDPTEVGVIADKGDDRLTLTACHPKYSAKQRIIVTATLLSSPADRPITPATAPAATIDHTSPGDSAGAPDGQPEPATADGRDLDRSVVGAEVGDGPADDHPTDAVALGDGESAGGQWMDTAALGQGPVDDHPADAVAASLGWQPGYAPATVAWAAFTALVALAAAVMGRLWRRVPAYAMAVPPFTLALFHCFANLEKFLPAV